MPNRIQRRRTKGWRMPPNTVSVCRPGPFGNPFRIDVNYVRDDMTAFQHTSESAVLAFAEWIRKPEQAALLARARRELRGFHVACFCEPDALYCHGDVWLFLVNCPVALACESAHG